MADDRIEYKLDGDVSGLVNAMKAATKAMEDLARAAAKAQEDVKEVNDEAKKAPSLYQKMGNGLKSLQKGFLTASKNAGIAAAAILAAGAAVGKFMQQMADSQNELSDMSSRTGVATKTLAGLRLAAKRSGQELSDLSSVLEPMIERMGQVKMGSESAKAGFEQLGVNVLDADGNLRSANDVLLEVSSALNQVEDDTDRAAKASLAFGGAGTKLIQALGGQELQHFVDAAAEFGADTGPAATKAAADWQRAVADLDMVMRPFTTDVLVWSTRRVNDFSLAWVWITTLLEELVKNILPNLGNAFMLILADLNIEAAETAKSMVDVFMGVIEDLAEVYASFTGDDRILKRVRKAIKAQDEAAESIKSYWQEKKIDIATNSTLADSYKIAFEKAQKFHEYLDTQTQKSDKRGFDPKTDVDVDGETFDKKEWESFNKKWDESMKKTMVVDGDIVNTEEWLEFEKQWNEAMARMAEEGVVPITQMQEALFEASEYMFEFADHITSLSDPTGLIRESFSMIATTMEQIASTDWDDTMSALTGIGNIAMQVGGMMNSIMEESIKTSDKLTDKQKKHLKILWLAQKAAVIAGIAMNTAGAIMKGYEQLGPIGGTIFAGVATALGITQAGIVAAQKPPFHSGGIIPADGGRQGVMINALPGESVLTREATASLGQDGVNSLNSGMSAGSQPLVVEMVYKHRVFDNFISDNISKGGPLSSAIRSGKRVGHRNKG